MGQELIAIFCAIAVVVILVTLIETITGGFRPGSRGVTSLDLKSERFNTTVRTTPERALSISAGELVNPYVQVVGTLAAPRLAVDETGLLITGGAAVATGGLSILARGIWDRLARSRDPCGQASANAIKDLQDRFPDIVIEAFERLE